MNTSIISMNTTRILLTIRSIPEIENLSANIDLSSAIYLVPRSTCYFFVKDDASFLQRKDTGA